MNKEIDMGQLLFSTIHFLKSGLKFPLNLKQVLTVIILLFSSQSFANVSLDKLHSFCRQSFSHKALAQYARNNDGKLKGGTSLEVIDTKNKRLITTIENKRSKYFRGCSQEISWLEEVRTYFCDYNSPDLKRNTNDLKGVILPEAIIFSFDGFGDFTSDAKDLLNAVNLDGSEGDDMSIGRFNGGNLFREITRALSWDDIRYQLHYHSSSGLHSRENLDSASSCFKHIDLYLDIVQLEIPNFIPPKILVLGYSNGGDNALDFQTTSEHSKRQIDLIISVDPIPKFYLYPVNKLVNVLKGKLDSTKRLINFYQTDDHGTIDYLGLSGRAVSRADQNFLMSYENGFKSMSKYGDSNHNRISSSFFVKHKSQCEARKVFSPKIDCEIGKDQDY